MADLGTVVSKLTRVTTAWVQDVNDYVYRNTPLSPMQFGALGDGTTDDGDALIAMFEELQTRGGGAVDLGGKTYRVTLPAGEALADLDGLRGVRICSAGARITIDRTFTVGQNYQLFKFTDCHNITIEPLRVYGTEVQTGSAKFDRGYEVVKLLEGCTNVDVSLDVENVRSAVMCRRESTDPLSYSSRNIRAVIRATNVGYPYNGILSGDDIDVRLDTDACTRSFYVYGVDGVRAYVRSKNHEGNADVLLASAVGYGVACTNVTYLNTDSTTTDNSIRGVVISFSDETPAVMRDIYVTVIVQLAGTYYIGSPFQVEKLDDDGNFDTSDRGHKLEDLDVDFMLTSGTGSQPSLRLCVGGTWGAGEFVDNVRLRMRTDGAGQPTINLASLVNVALLENSYSSVQVNLTGNTAGVVDVNNSKALSWSTTGVVRYNGFLLGSATYDPASLAAGATQQTTVTVTGAVVGDTATASHSTVDAAIVWSAQVTSANTVTVTMWNRSASPVDLASGTLRALVAQKV